MALPMILCVVTMSSVQSNAQGVISYPFDSIRVTSAFKFNIFIDSIPAANSVLFGHVNAGESLTVYIGQLEFVYNGAPAQGSNSIIMLTNATGEDFCKWLVNSSGSDNSTYSGETFASWITIDPKVGVIKDFTGDLLQISYMHYLATNTFTFTDNTSANYNMIPGSYVNEPGLDIVISAYKEN
jgi:hypothetical protein